MAKKDKPAKKKEEPKPKNPYAEGDNPTWITEPPAVTIESPKGRRLHVYSDEDKPKDTKKNKVLVTGKDWEDKAGNLHPGKVISMPSAEWNALVVGYLKEVYDYDFVLEEE